MTGVDFHFFFRLPFFIFFSSRHLFWYLFEFDALASEAHVCAQVLGLKTNCPFFPSSFLPVRKKETNYCGLYRVCMGKFTVCTSMKPKHRTYFIPSRGWEKKKTRDSNIYWSTGKKCIPGIRIGMGFEWHLDCKFSVDFNGNAIYGTREREKERWRFFCFIFDC